MTDSKNFPGNSNRDKAVPPKVVNRVTTGAMRRGTRKQSKSAIMTDAQRIASDIGTDILLPAIKTLFVELITNGINMVLYGESQAPRKRNIGYGGRERRPGVRYGGYYRDRHEPHEPERIRARPAIAGDKVDRMVYDIRPDAVQVLSGLCDIITSYGSTSVADLYGLAGITAAYTDSAYGWLSLDSAQVVPVSGGYIIDLPSPIPLE